MDKQETLHNQLNNVYIIIMVIMNELCIYYSVRRVLNPFVDIMHARTNIHSTDYDSLDVWHTDSYSFIGRPTTFNLESL